MKHTATPWVADIGDREGDGSSCWVIDSEEGSIAEMTCPKDVEEANALHIVHCVNKHDALVEVLTKAMRVVADRAAGGKMLTTKAEAKSILDQCEAALKGGDE